MADGSDRRRSDAMARRFGFGPRLFSSFPEVNSRTRSKAPFGPGFVPKLHFSDCSDTLNIDSALTSVWRYKNCQSGASSETIDNRGRCDVKFFLDHSSDRVAPPKSPYNVYLDAVGARFYRAMHSDSPLLERLIWFWSNHLAVSVRGGGLLWPLVGTYELQTIAPAALTAFDDMLVSAIKHPAMLLYLDGYHSIGDRSPLGRRLGRGINENLAREILELHTVGLGGHYKQKDVGALAEMLTGWRFWPLRSTERGRFRFVRAMHQPGPKTFLGEEYSDEGVEVGVRALRRLAYHPATGRRLAKKLAEHFIADDAPKDLVQELAVIFGDTRGDLGAVSTGLVKWAEGAEPPPAKLRLPQEFLAAMLCATGIRLKPAVIERMCRVMGHPVWAPAGPDGFPDSVTHWLSPEGMKRRLDVAMAVGARVDPALEPMEVLEVAIGDIATDDTRLAVERAESRQQAFALLFMSPEFQWR